MRGTFLDNVGTELTGTVDCTEIDPQEISYGLQSKEVS